MNSLRSLGHIHNQALPAVACSFPCRFSNCRVWAAAARGGMEKQLEGFAPCCGHRQSAPPAAGEGKREPACLTFWLAEKCLVRIEWRNDKNIRTEQQTR